jgi:hypothetical protein
VPLKDETFRASPFRLAPSRLAADADAGRLKRQHGAPCNAQHEQADFFVSPTAKRVAYALWKNRLLLEARICTTNKSAKKQVRDLTALAP